MVGIRNKFEDDDSGAFSNTESIELVDVLSDVDLNEELFDDETAHSSSHHDEIQDHIAKIQKTQRKTRITAVMVVLVGAASAAAFLYLGITAQKSDVKEQFERRASDMTKEINGAWDDYEAAARWAHSECRNFRTDNFTYADFEAVYKYLTSSGLDFFSVDWIPNITHAERAEVERTEGAFWKTIEGAENYDGFTGQEPDPDNQPGGLMYAARSEQPFYFPIYFIEPKSAAASIIHYDLFSPPWERPAIEQALSTKEPALTGRFILAQHTEDDGYSVLLYHPGVDLPDHPNERNDLSAIVLSVNPFLKHASRAETERIATYLFDSTLNELDGAAPEFLGAIEINDKSEVIHLREHNYTDLLDSRLYFESSVRVGGRTWTTVVVAVDGTYEENLVFVYFSSILIFVASILLAIWMETNLRRSMHLNQIISKAAAEASIVASLFPANVRDRMIKDAEAMNNQNRNDIFRASAKGRNKFKVSEDRLNDLTSEGVFKGKPIADLHPYTTVMVADLCGFTAWSSVREPSQVFTLLELVFHAFDTIGQRRRVYKVETVGDSYVAVAGLPEPRDDHCVVMTRFAQDCLNRFRSLVRVLEKTLGPDTAELGCRFGLHSGQVVAGVLRGAKGRFQLFGDTVNMAARMESTGVPNRIHCSQETADLLKEAGREDWLVAREKMVDVKGKGFQQTYMVKANCVSKQDHNDSVRLEDATIKEHGVTSGKMGRLVQWNVEVLSGLLRSIVARREAMGKRSQAIRTAAIRGEMVLDEVKEIISLPEYGANAVKREVNPVDIDLDPKVVEQLKELITRIANTYRNNPFHNFEHASHVLFSVTKMLGRIVAPKVVGKNKNIRSSVAELDREKHDHTFGITSDPLTQFACAFSALIHDADHQGVPNMVLVKEEDPLAAKYNGNSVAEQNSVDVAWSFLMSPEFEKLRSTICCDDEEFVRFRQLVVNSVMATDIMDKQLGAARKARWNKAFNIDTDSAHFMGEEEAEEHPQDKINRKATIVIEHLIQASDISHTMQHWHVYAKWNERLFLEMYKAYKAGRMEKDPSVGWYQGEIGFFDFYIIPLARKLFKCGVFGVSSDEFLNYALINRKEWEQKGEQMVARYLRTYNEKFEGGVGAKTKNEMEGSGKGNVWV